MGIFASNQALLVSFLALASIGSCQDSPSVDLGYEVHTSSINVSPNLSPCQISSQANVDGAVGDG
jgi:hypothetical protein